MIQSFDRKDCLNHSFIISLVYIYKIRKLLQAVRFQEPGGRYSDSRNKVWRSSNLNFHISLNTESARICDI